MNKKLETLMEEAEVLLASQLYSEETIKQYRIKWRKFATFCIERLIECPTRKDGELFVKEYEQLHPPKKSHRLMLTKAIELLFDAQYGIGLSQRNGREKYFLPDQFSSEWKRYKESLIAKKQAQATIKGRVFQAKRFLSWLGDVPVADVPSITAEHVYDYIASISWMRPQSISDTLFILRNFLIFLCENCNADHCLRNLFPVIRSNKNSVLPSVYSTEEISKLLDNLDTSGRCALRDKAIILLAAQQGFRAGDILALKLRDIDWGQMIIGIKQKKTGARLSLPLQEEAAFAIIDYLKNERPDIEDSHIFLTHCAPYKPLAASEASHHMQISQLFERSGVDTFGKHHGLHSIRHSLAVNMLESKTLLPVLSEVLGHSGSDVTRNYLRVDVERLRSLSLEVPHGC